MINYTTLSNEVLDHLIHEQVMGECWHETGDYYFKDPDSDFWSGIRKRCKKCSSTSIYNPKYCTSWEDYGRLLEKVKKHKEWDDFKMRYVERLELLQDELDIMFDFVDIITDKRKGCEAIAEYFVP